MQNNLEVIRNKRARGFILQLLKVTYPQPTASFTLSAALQENGIIINPDITAYLNYLKDSGYIELQEISMKSMQTVTVLAKLTPDGIDLLEGTTDDPGVDI